MSKDNFAETFDEFMCIYKLVNRKAVIDALKGELKTKQQIEIYQLTDGEKSTRELCANLKNKCSHVTVASLWNKWALVGIVTPVRQKGRYKAVFNLIEYGITKVDSEE